MEINPPKTVCGCPWGGVIRNGDVSNPLTLWNANKNIFFLRHLCQDMAQVDVSIKIKIKIKMTASVLKDCWHDNDV